MTDRIIKIGFILTPLFWFYVGMNSLQGAPLLPRQGQFVAFMCVAVAALSWMSANIWIRAFGLYSVAWVIFANIYAICVPMPETVAAAINARDYARHIMVALAIYVAVTRVEIDTESWFNFICIGAVVQSLIAIPQYFGIYPDAVLIGWTGIRTDHSLPIVIGTMENSNFFSAYLAISLPFFFRRNWAYFLPVIVFHLVMAKTTTALAAAVVAVCVFVGRSDLWLLGFGLVCLYIFIKPAFIGGQTIMTNPRWEDWATAIRNYNLHWFSIPFGHGPYASWGKPYPLHNDYLQYLFEFGAVGLGLIAGYIYTIFRGNRILFAAGVAVFVNMIGNFPTQLPPTAFLTVLILALIEKEKLEHDRIQHNPTGRICL